MGHATTQCTTAPQLEKYSTFPYREWLKAGNAPKGPQPQPRTENQPANPVNPVAPEPPSPTEPTPPESHTHPTTPDTTIKTHNSSNINHDDPPNPSPSEDHGIPKNMTLTLHGQPDMETPTGPTPIITKNEQITAGDPPVNISKDLPLNDTPPKEIPQHTLLNPKTEGVNHYANQFEEIKIKTKALKSWKRVSKGETVQTGQPLMEVPIVGQKRLSHAILDANNGDSPTPKKNKRPLIVNHAYTESLAGAAVQPHPSQ